MAQNKHKLNYRGRNWKKIGQEQTRKWNSKNGAVVLVQAADPTKIDEARVSQQIARNLYGLTPKKYKNKNRIKSSKN